jgi:hypothetical protein
MPTIACQAIHTPVTFPVDGHQARAGRAYSSIRLRRCNGIATNERQQIVRNFVF